MSTTRVAILTVSDTASADASADRSGPAIRDLLIINGEFECKYSLIVPDDEARVRHTVRTWCEQGEVDWVLTIGGTGFGVRDRTPEAIRPLIERDAPGLVHLLLASSLQKSPLAALSRPVAGTVKNTLVVTLPGSMRAARENVEALLANGVIDHALRLVKSGSGVQLHAILAAAASDQQSKAHHHHHHHHTPQPGSVLSHDPALPVTMRQRESPYPPVSVDSATSSILSAIKPLPMVQLPFGPELKGHVLAVDVHAPQDLPSTSTANVDGYALHSYDQPGVYRVLTSRTHKLSDPLPLDAVYRINTGAPLPAGADTIIMVEDTRLHSTVNDDSGQEEEKEVETLVQVPKGDNVRAPGSDVRKDELVLEAGQVLHDTGGEIGTLAFVGRKEVGVYRKPVVAIMSTGSELIDVRAPKSLESDSQGGIWDTNRPSLQAALEGMGYRVVDLGIVPDDLDAHVSTIEKGLQEADLLLTTGGTSMGTSDLLKPVIERQLGGTVHFGRVSVEPGKSTTFATIRAPAHPNGSIPMFALPGSPAAALVTFNIFVIPALRRLGGWPMEHSQLPKVMVKIQDSMQLHPCLEYHRIIIKAGPTGLNAYSTGGRRSNRVAGLSGANGLVALPAKGGVGPDKLEVGEMAEAVVIGELQMY